MTINDSTVLALAQTSASEQSLRGLDWFNFFLSGVLTGFGPFVALYLAGRSWTQVEIGFVLTASGLAALATQVPAGELLDTVQAKRPLVAIGVATVAAAALILALLPSFTPVLIAEGLLGVVGGFLGPAVAAISLGLVEHDVLPERLGRNQRFAAIGGFTTAGLMGLLGYLSSNRLIFFATATLAVPALLALSRIRGEEIHFARACCGPPGEYHPARPPRKARRHVGMNDRLLIFTACVVLFQLANASMLPLVGEELARHPGASLVVSALVFVPQIGVALMAPWVGRAAKSWGRRPLLLLGLGALPIRAACFALVSDPVLLVAVQVLDGISAAVIGVLTPLIIADITKGTGRFNLAQGIVGTFSGIGAALSTTASGYVAQSFGTAAAFSAMAGVALASGVLGWLFLPETKSTSSVSKLGPISALPA
jgi:MFS family permease